MADIQRPPASLVLFARGVIARLETWSILRVAVQEGWGGPNSAEKRTWLASEIVDAFEKQVPPPDDQYVEELLLQVMADEFDCIVEDESGEGVGKDIVQIWEESQSGKQDAILKFEESAGKLKGKKIDAQITSEENEEDAGDDDEWEDESDDEGVRVDEAPQLIDHRTRNEPEVDENGFTLVKRKGRGGR
ncbi:hypothetical protein M378DRAFT_191669 [Amanita muscaria Koide BX008]|uniref:Pre-rRNA-processing protein TSR2 n=1 Tax=Amanita muscaria (strain Koide BX008) TaxID=946122 RepID=A0A0C2TJN4_AMAMK|nr:hypothetical protein M378DRAFT_191669 [Amanita muscaria Koide BX008]